MEEVRKLLRPCILAAKPYKPSRTNDKGILLDSNENNFGSVLSENDGLHRYPNPLHGDLKRKVAAFRGMRPEQVFLGLGADESIDTVIRAFCKPGSDAMIVIPPTFSMYEQRAVVCDVRVIAVPLQSNFQLDMNTLLKEAVAPEVKVIFLVSPGNPTAVSLNTDDIVRLLESDYRGIVLLDEIYIDFATSKQSLCHLVNKYPRLIILQSLSKSFGLAGIRLGWSIAHEEVITNFDKIRLPYNICSPAYEAGLEALSCIHAMKEKVKLVVSEREKLAEALSQMEEVKRVNAVSVISKADNTWFFCQVFPSETNFLIIKVERGLHVRKVMSEKGVSVAYSPSLDCLRVSVCTTTESEIVLKVLKDSCREAVK
eukprot:m.21926 g.21926  ORF g.21926 m.21926 type:complete len:370 (+) comp28244_c0_seq4:88-1197(+)